VKKINRKLQNAVVLFLFSLQGIPGKTFSSILCGKEDLLEEMIDMEHGLLSKLIQYRVITSSHRAAVEVIVVTVFIF